MNFDDWTTIGRILLRRGSLSEKQLLRALEEQAERKTTRLGDLLVELKLCDRGEVNAAMREQEVTRIPTATSEATVQAEALLRAAFARVETETRRLEDRPARSDRGAIVLKISGDS